MIIRSQRKGMILNMDCIAKIYVDDVLQENTKIFKYGIVADKEIIAVYSTEEKAIKVLDMICDAYCKMKSCDCIFSGYSIDLCKTSQEGIDNFIETNRKLYVFEMPQDSEV